MSSSLRRRIVTVGKRSYSYYTERPVHGFPPVSYPSRRETLYGRYRASEPPQHEQYHGEQYAPHYQSSVTWRLPESDDDIEKFLMKWTNVVGNEFLTNMRKNVILWGAKTFSDKQKIAIRNCVAHKDTKFRRALYPAFHPIDPTMKDLLLLTDKDLETVATKKEKDAEVLKELKTSLCDRRSLSYKQLKFAASLLHQYELSTESNTNVTGITNPKV